MKGYKKVFLVAACVTLGVIGMVVLAGITAYNTFVYDDGNKIQVSQKVVSQETIETTQEGEHVPEETKEKINKTVAILGTDITGGLTDVIFVANFDSETKEVNVVAIPRDTKVDWSEEQIAILPRQHQWIRTGKINEMTSWGGIENIRPLTITTIEHLLGTKVDEYVVVSLNAFREIVDAIGGVEV
ncbi:MAG: LCP family protein, partial [Niameybacter sp.]